MLAVRLHDDGLKVEEIETPSADPGEVLVRVHAAAITRDELDWRSIDCRRFPLTSFRALSSEAVTRYMRSRLSIATAWLPNPVVPADVLAPNPCG